MKIIFVIIAIPLFVSSCDHIVDRKMIDRATIVCAHFGGMAKIELLGTNYTDCKDGTRIDIAIGTATGEF